MAVAFVAGAILAGRVDSVRDVIDEPFGGSSGDASEQALEVIEDNYFEEIDPEELESDSVRAIVNELKKTYKDRFSHYFGPHAFKRFEEVTEGSFSGVGMSVTEVKRGLRVATVFDDSPAKEAGIAEGDLITEVDGDSIAGEDADLATAKIKGRPGSEVTLTVDPASGKGERQVTVTRRQLRVPAVEGSLKRVNGIPIAYVRLLGFSGGAHAELRREIERLDDRGAEGLVLDLRGNGGGLLTEAVLTSSLFVEDGVIVTTHGRSQGDETFEAVGDALPERPTVVLINHDTASASEILTAALSQAGLAEVVGQRSFGKGTFQEVIPLENGGALDLTIGEYLTRDGTSINGTGIEPDLKARDLLKTKPDEGRQQALEALAAKISGD
ncbi:MAG: S41 family peptidase [Solirubrobacterales bacterium]